MVDYVAFFDADCITCNRFINYVLRVDRKKKIRFSKINSDFYKKMNINLDNLDSIIYFKSNKTFYYTDAITEILKDTHSFFVILNIQYLVPQLIRKKIYTFFSKRRKKNLKACILLMNHPCKDRFI